jgi:hypothetical protein
MENIKTLREIAEFEQNKFEKETKIKLVNGTMPLNIEVIRAEAIKRINSCKNRVENFEDNRWFCGESGGKMDGRVLCNACKRDMFFNNLTEDDLNVK